MTQISYERYYISDENMFIQLLFLCSKYWSHPYIYIKHSNAVQSNLKCDFFLSAGGYILQNIRKWAFRHAILRKRPVTAVGRLFIATGVVVQSCDIAVFNSIFLCLNTVEICNIGQLNVTSNGHGSNRRPGRAFQLFVANGC
jgi:hypothetical protein